MTGKIYKIKSMKKHMHIYSHLYIFAYVAIFNEGKRDITNTTGRKYLKIGRSSLVEL